MILLKEGGKVLNKRNKKGDSYDRSFILFYKPLSGEVKTRTLFVRFIFDLTVFK